MRIVIILTLFSLAFVGILKAELQPPPVNPLGKSNNINQTANNKIKPEPEKIISVKILPAPDSDAKTAKEEKKEQEKASTDKLVANSTFGLAVITGILAIFTGALWLATRKLVIDAKDTSKRQLRAYLSVSIGGGMYQERHKNIRFEVKPNLLNSGNTPAHKITYWARAEVLPFPLSDNFDFPPTEDTLQSSLVLGPHQNIILNAVVNEFFPEEEAGNIKRGSDRRLYIWGIVSYTDVFGDSHTTRFCHSIYWFGPTENETIAGYYASRHNEAD